MWAAGTVAGYNYNMEKLRIATRQSALALWQANHIKSLLESAHAELQCEIIGMTTLGDRNKSSPLSQMGGKGVFVKELETALLDGSADIAVHSMKDVPGELPRGLAITSIVERASAQDAFVSNRFESLADLPKGSRVGSSSLRRVRQLQLAYPGLEFIELRGNVDTRLRKLDDGEYDAVILAVAGLARLGLSNRVREAIATDICIPAAGQGAVGIESRSNDPVVTGLVESINHSLTWICVTAERKVTQLLGATCNLPVAVYAEPTAGEFLLNSFISDPGGNVIIREQVTGKIDDSASLAERLGNNLLARGAVDLMAEH
ncbi:MAG: hydroxymethylbilane synthase [Pseudomonadales bacterium]|nr:hydroxymethylbilane synthase [Pseudomonadales bacterium]